MKTEAMPDVMPEVAPSTPPSPAPAETPLSASRRAASLWREYENALLSSQKKVDFDDGITAEFLALLAPPSSPTQLSFKEDIAAVQSVISSLIEVVDRGILSESDAEAIISSVMASFVSRRVDNTMKRIFSPSRSLWMLAASQHIYGKRGPKEE